MKTKCDLMKRVALAGVGLCLASAPGQVAIGAQARPDADSPNVVVIYTDDQPWDTIGHYNEKGDAYTPAMDHLFTHGMVCENAYVTSTVCSPSRYSLLTGRHAGRCAAPSFLTRFPADRPHRLENNVRLERNPMMNVAGLLSRAGYQTGFVGKSHITEHDFAFETYPKDADPRVDAATNAKMKRNHERLCESIKEYGFGWVDAVYAANLAELRNQFLNVNNLEWCADAARRFIAEKKDEPFFLYFATTAHHGPETFRGQGDGPYRHGLDADIGYTGEGYVSETYGGLPSRDTIKAKAMAHGASHKTANYTLLDVAVQGILEKLRELGLEEKTLILFASDHGTGFSSKTTLYDRGMRVPMTWCWKGRIPPGHYPHMISNIDVAPTVLSLCGVRLPETYVTDGMDFSDVLLGDRKREIRTSLLGELGYARAILTREWKYIAIRYPDDVQERIDRGETFPNFKDHPPLRRPYLVRNTHLGYHYSKGNPLYFEPDQLFQRSGDGLESVNLANSHSGQLAAMQALLAEGLREIGRPFGEFSGGTQ